jgi:hypothetical protein
MDPISIALGLAQLAPVIAKWIGGDKAEEGARKAVEIAETVTGRKGPDAIEALKADPNLLLQYQTKVIDAETERQKNLLADTQNARNQTIELAKAKSNIAWGSPVVSVIVTMGYFGALYLILAKPITITDNYKDVLLFMLGALQIGFGQVCNYWLGSSVGSTQKTAILDKLTAR